MCGHHVYSRFGTDLGHDRSTFLWSSLQQRGKGQLIFSLSVRARDDLCHARQALLFRPASARSFSIPRVESDRTIALPWGHKKPDRGPNGVVFSENAILVCHDTAQAIEATRAIDLVGLEGLEPIQ